MEREIKKTQLTRRKETMKKLAIFALVLGLAVAFTVPAFAFKIESAKDQTFYFGGTIMTDIGYWGESQERTARYGETSSRTSVFLNTPRHSNIRMIVESGDTGAYFELRYGRDWFSSHEQGDTATTSANSASADKNNRLNYIEPAQLYGWYKFGNCRILAGKTAGHVFSILPYQNLGLENANHVFGLGWGAYYDDRATQIRFEQNISKAFSWHIALVQPWYTDFNDPITGKNYDSYAEFPAVALKFTLNFGAVTLFPAGTYQKIKWQDIPGQWDTSMESWIVMLPVRFMAGGFQALGQVSWGQNVGIPGYHTLQNPLANPTRGTLGNSLGKFRNTNSVAGFVDLSYKAGTVTPHIYFGYDKVSSDEAWKVGDTSTTRTMWGASAQIAISPNFNIIPEITYYDYGKLPGVAGSPDQGNEWLAGAQFQFVF
jgi:hypothetical protein